ncbi:ribosome assembly protein RRB1 [Geosmithia morbida]|uniref:Glutamate-rich WD repeat-containing protein 1 n=1 Tax=Geosmithia morbida TaxID=1094350 RepID=A0A9P5D2T8_9HYPO|nr:ribosome assembly protein RRB1 [Geosmithia morbida]KAF4119824.1 ribosome assembly protein RRB1 [Geosmithia morbida]
MSKRTAADGGDDTPLKGGDRPDQMDVDDQPNKEMGEFEDEFEDEFESEDEIFEAGIDGRPDAEREAEEKDGMDVDQAQQGTFIVGRNKLEPGQTLSPDMTTYEMLHSLSTPWPCLSFDIIRDSLGDNRKTYPATMYTVAGTQAESARASDNQLIVMKFSGLSKTSPDDKDGSDDEDDDDDDEDADPILESRSIPLKSCTNRVRAHAIPNDQGGAPTTLTASMTESSGVLIHDITPHLTSFDTPGATISAQQNKPLSTVRIHKSEGYGIDWSPTVHGRLLTGDNDGLIYMTSRTDGGGWQTDNRAFQGHTGSVEEIQWSPSEQSVFASASSDGTIRIWDVRSKARKAAITMQVSDYDVNVMSWSRQTSHLLASGADDGTWGVWDLRQWKVSSDKPQPLASFNFHKEQITSVEWHPTDDSIVAVAAGDNTVSLWDLAVELDDEESKTSAVPGDVPPQLLFVHYLKDVKEVHWHPQIIGSLVATGEDFSVFRTISV